MSSKKLGVLARFININSLIEIILDKIIKDDKIASFVTELVEKLLMGKLEAKEQEIKTLSEKVKSLERTSDLYNEMAKAAKKVSE